MKIKDFMTASNGTVNSITVHIPNSEEVVLPGTMINFGYLGIPVGNEWVPIWDCDINTFSIENGGFTIDATAPVKPLAKKVSDFMAKNEERINKILDHYGANDEPVLLKELEEVVEPKIEETVKSAIDKFVERQSKKKEKIETPYNSNNSHQKPRWEAGEISIINDKSLSNKEVAIKLGRTIKSVDAYRLRHGIKSEYGKRSFSEEEIAAMSDTTLSAKEIAEAYNRTTHSVNQWRYRNGFVKKYNKRKKEA